MDETENLSRGKRYYRENKIKMKEAAKAWRKSHPGYYRNYKWKNRKEWYRKNRARVLEKCRWRNAHLRLEVLRHYSPELKCERCDYSDVRALTIDHLFGGGAEHRRLIKKQTLYGWLKKMNYPDEYRVLCMNCQFIKRYENNETRGLNKR